MTHPSQKLPATAHLETAATFEASVDGALIRGSRAGRGSPVLLLHGFPQTRLEWHRVWRDLAARHTVVATDLRGYGASEAHDNDFTFRTMARDQVAAMDQLGFDRFHVVAHDRGARVAHRMCVDSPESVISVTLIDIVPTAVVWERMDADIARAYWHWAFLAQHDPGVAAMVAAAPEQLVRACLAPGILAGAISPGAQRAYEDAAARPGVQRAFIGDYRAAAGADLVIDAAEPSTSPTPALILWGERSIVPRIADPRDAWRRIFPDARFASLPAGHFIPEESPAGLLSALRPFLEQADWSSPTTVPYRGTPGCAQHGLEQR